MGGGFPGPALAVLGVVHAHPACAHREEDCQGASTSYVGGRERKAFPHAATSLPF